MSVLGVIPARGGSNRVPRKNIRLLAGKPLIGYTIEAALAARGIDRLIISTDDREISEIAKTFGAEVPFMRPDDLAGDTVPDQPVFQHVLEELKARENYEPHILVNLRPTTPLKTPQTIDRVIETAIETGADVVRTMCPVEGVHHPYWMYRLDDEGKADTFLSDMDVSQFYQRQLLPPAYRINGVVDAMKTALVFDGNILGSKNMRGVVIAEEESVDIDTEFDFLLCELLIKNRSSSG